MHRKKLLHIIVRRHPTRGPVEPDQIRGPLVVSKPRKERCVTRHLDDIAIALITRHYRRFADSAPKRIDLLAFNAMMARVFADIDVRLRAIVSIITSDILQEPLRVAIEMLVNQVRSFACHTIPCVAEFPTIRLRPGTSDNLNLGMFRADNSRNRLHSIKELGIPIFITDTHHFEIKRSRMAHLGTHLAPGRGDVAVCKFNEFKNDVREIVCILHSAHERRLLILAG